MVSKPLPLKKPMALSLAGRQILTLCATAGVKTIICHQLKYGAHWQSSGDRPQWGAWRHTHATRHGAAVHAARRHAPGGHYAVVQRRQRGLWVMGQAHGTAAYAEDHPCPDHIMGVIQFANGVRGLLECGTLAPHVMPGGFLA